MTTEETKKFLQEEGVAQTLETIFTKAKELSVSGLKVLDVIMPDFNTASKFNSVILDAGYASAVVSKDNTSIILIYL